MKTITFGNGARTTVTPPTLNGDNIALAGTTAASEPFVIFADATAPSVIGTISEVGTFGVVETGPINQAAVPNLVVGSLMLSRGNVFMGTTAGGSVTITGTSYIATTAPTPHGEAGIKPIPPPSKAPWLSQEGRSPTFHTARSKVRAPSTRTPGPSWKQKPSQPDSAST
jgi:hypothetical protein